MLTSLQANTLVFAWLPQALISSLTTLTLTQCFNYLHFVLRVFDTSPGLTSLTIYSYEKLFHDPANAGPDAHLNPRVHKALRELTINCVAGSAAAAILDYIELPNLHSLSIQAIFQETGSDDSQGESLDANTIARARGGGVHPPFEALQNLHICCSFYPHHLQSILERAPHVSTLVAGDHVLDGLVLGPHLCLQLKTLHVLPSQNLISISRGNMLPLNKSGYDSPTLIGTLSNVLAMRPSIQQLRVPPFNADPTLNSEITAPLCRDGLRIDTYSYMA